jgi:uracil-DNA glycosylase
MLVGEQPGSEEDLAGKPFVGPAGRLLRTLCAEAGLDPAKLFFTNAVKHFRWEPRGKRRLHKTPYQRHITACHQWLAREIAAIRPSVIVALGRTALLALTGHVTKIADARLQTLRLADGTPIVGSYHPSAILRAIPAAKHDEMRQALLMDLRRAALLASR